MNDLRSSGPARIIVGLTRDLDPKCEGLIVSDIVVRTEGVFGRGSYYCTDLVLIDLICLVHHTELKNSVIKADGREELESWLPIAKRTNIK